MENIKQGFRKTVSWNKCRFEIIKEPKTNNLVYMINPTFRNINRLFIISFNNGDDDTKGDIFCKYVWHEIIFNTAELKSNLCHYYDAYILLRGYITNTGFLISMLIPLVVLL